MIKKEFLPVGKLEMTFKNGLTIKTVGRDSIPTCVNVEFDENGKNNAKVEIIQVEIELGLVSKSIIEMPPLLSYDFVNYLNLDKIGKEEPKSAIESWRLT